MSEAHSTQRQLADQMTQWTALHKDVAGSGYNDAHVICDASERVLARIDQPRVRNMPKLRYAPPNPQTRNWTLFPIGVARHACRALDAQAPAFGPHRVVHVRDLASEQIQAAERGLELLMHVEDPYLSEAVSSLKFS